MKNGDTGGYVKGNDIKGDESSEYLRYLPINQRKKWKIKSNFRIGVCWWWQISISQYIRLCVSYIFKKKNTQSLRKTIFIPLQFLKKKTN